MKFKVGDKVRIRRNLQLLPGEATQPCGIVGEMLEYEGSVDAVEEVYNGFYMLRGNEWEWTDAMLEPTEAPTTDDNPYWANITKIAQSQRRKGLGTYGHPLEDFQTPDAKERIQYIEEELVDALMYLEWLKDRK